MPNCWRISKDCIRRAQVHAVVAASRELICLYWEIGREIVQRQGQAGWGKAVVQCLAADLQREFPGVAGFSPQNIWYMRSFYLAWTDDAAKLQQPVGELGAHNVPQVLGQIPWGHNLQLLAKLRDPTERLWYAEKVVQHGWSRAVLVHQIELDLYGREGRAITNFSETLPPIQSDLAQQVLKGSLRIRLSHSGRRRPRARTGAKPFGTPPRLHAGTRRRLRLRRKPVPC